MIHEDLVLDRYFERRELFCRYWWVSFDTSSQLDKGTLFYVFFNFFLFFEIRSHSSGWPWTLASPIQMPPIVEIKGISHHTQLESAIWTYCHNKSHLSLSYFNEFLNPTLLLRGFQSRLWCPFLRSCSFFRVCLGDCFSFDTVSAP